MAEVKMTMAAIGNEPKTCLGKFKRGETMYAVEYANGDKAGWHNKECLDYWHKCGKPKCSLAQKGE